VGHLRLGLGGLGMSFADAVVAFFVQFGGQLGSA